MSWIMIAVWVYLGLSAVSFGVSLMWLMMLKKWLKTDNK